MDKDDLLRASDRALLGITQAHPSFHIGDRESRVAALSRKPQHIDANAPLARCLDPQCRKPRVEVLETANAVAAILTRRFDFFIGAGIAMLLQTECERSVVDLHVAQ